MSRYNDSGLKSSEIYHIRPQEQWGENVTTGQPPPYDIAVENKGRSNQSHSQLQNGVTHANGTVQPITTTIIITSVPNYIWWSVLNIFCCCWICGCVACCWGIKVDKSLQKNQYEEAREASKAARQCNVAGTAFGIGIMITWLIIHVIAGAKHF